MNTTPSRVRTVVLLGSFALVAAVLIAGCSPARPPRGKLSGTVTVNGKPLTGGLIGLNYPDKSTFTINVKPDGTFSTEDAPPGDVKVTVRSIPGGVGGGGGPIMPKGMEGMMKDKKGYPMPGGQQMPNMGAPMAVPTKYMDPNSTPISWKIEANKTETKTLELTN